MVAVAMNDVCLSDWLPCSCMVKGVGIGSCVKTFRGKIVICSRLSDVSILEFSIRENIREACVVDYDLIKRMGAERP